MSQQTVELPALVHLQEVSAFLGMPDHTIRRLVRLKKFPQPIRLAGRWLWRAKDLKDYLEQS